MKNRTNLVHLVIACLLALLLAPTTFAGELDGTWSFVFDRGDHSRDITLKVAGEKVTGKMNDEIYTGTFKAGQLELSGKHHASETGYADELKISGKLEDGKLEGTATWGQYSLAFTAAKQ